MHREMSRLCGHAPVVEHDLCLPPERTQDDRDRLLWRECRQAIIGVESAGDAARLHLRVRAEAAPQTPSPFAIATPKVFPTLSRGASNGCGTDERRDGYGDLG